jgi:hypothetical protein
MVQADPVLSFSVLPNDDTMVSFDGIMGGISVTQYTDIFTTIFFATGLCHAQRMSAWLPENPLDIYNKKETTLITAKPKAPAKLRASPLLLLFSAPVSVPPPELLSPCPSVSSPVLLSSASSSVSTVLFP